MPNPEVAELLVVKVRCRINGCRRTKGHSGEHMDSDALDEYVIASHERYIAELEARIQKLTRERDAAHDRLFKLVEAGVSW